MDRKIRVAVAGIGQIATKAHIPAYLSNRHVDLVALIDIDNKKVKRAAKQFGVKQFFSSIDELFEKEDVEAVSVCTPPNTHADVTLKALGYGAHVLCEKPLATTVDDGKRMVKASQTEEKILMVGFQRRFRPNYKRAKNLISSGSLGHVYCIEDHLLQPSPLLKWGKSNWFYEPGVGGVLIDLGPHVFDVLNYLFGDFPHAVSARSSTYLDSPVEECCVCVLEYPKGRIGVGLLSWLSSMNIENVNIHGTAQSLFVSPKLFLEVNATDNPEISLWRSVSELLISLKFPNFPLLSPHTCNIVNTYQLEINHFINQIRDNRKSYVSALNALNVLMACNDAKKSIEMNKRIKISSLKRI